MNRRTWMTFLATQLCVVSYAAVAAALPICQPVSPAFTGGSVTVNNAAIVNPSSPVTGTVDATGCDAAVYYGPGKSGSVTNATIFGSIQAGIVNNGANVTIDSNSIYQIGDSPFTGAQHGYAIYMYGLNSPASGNITRNIVWNYQKNGIVVRGAKSTIRYNTVIGQGPVNYIAANGIEVGYGSGSTIDSNRVFGNSYTGSNAATGAGVLLFGGPCYDGPAQTNTSVTSNELSGNDIGVSSNNLAADCVSSVNSATRNTIQSNTIRNNAIFNTSGGPLTSPSPSLPYQAGVSDQGKSDVIIANSICGIGYTPQGSTPPYIFSVDTTLAIGTISLLNFCGGN